jgi:threonine aldolase
MMERNRQEIIRQCTRFVVNHYPVSPHDMLAALAAFTPPGTAADQYGSGELIANFEAEVAQLLGKETAVFMPSGTMAQQIALRIHANRSGNKTVAFHPTCHLELHEQSAYRELHQLSGVLVGNPHALMTLDDLKAVKQPVGTLLIELPQREIGGMLPGWDELTELVAYARGQGMAVHLDGGAFVGMPAVLRPFLCRNLRLVRFRLRLVLQNAEWHHRRDAVGGGVAD